MLNRNAARPTAFQFTHPRRVRRKSILHLGSASLLVSIHAPTRGATRTGQLEHLGIGVSIHVPTRGATAKWRRHCGLSRFQFTHPRWVRLRRQSARRARARVSIHAPARGATVLGFIYLFLRPYNAFFAKYYIVSCFCVYYAYFYSQIIEY